MVVPSNLRLQLQSNEKMLDKREKSNQSKHLNSRHCAGNPKHHGVLNFNF